MTVLSELGDLLAEGIDRHGVPGASVAIHRRGRRYGAVAGLLNVDTGVEVTGDSVFQIGSITKIFTTTLVMQLVSEGRLDLDRPVSDVLRGFATANAETSGTVTARHLLSHTSGIDGDLFVDSGRGDDNIARLIDMGRLLPSLYPLGERVSYCNFGFSVLGRMVEILDGDTWDSAMKRRIFDPLGLEHALTLPEDTLRHRAAVGHIADPKRKGDQMVTPVPWLSLGQKAAGATPMMSAGDVLRFAEMHMRGGEAVGGEQVLPRRAVRQMQQRQVKLPKHFARGLDSWGLGWMLARWSDTRVVGHDGATFGQFAFLRIVPDADLAVVLLTNGGDATGLFEDLGGRVLGDLAGVEMPSAPPVDDELTTKIAAAPDRYLGRYGNLTGSTEIKLDNGQIVMATTPTDLPGTAPLRPTPLGFVDRNTARLMSGDPMLDRTCWIFADAKDRPARYLMSTRVLPRA